MRLSLPVSIDSATIGEKTAIPTDRSRVVNVAHRGASDAMPENTLAAVRLALACGADMVEVDVQRTRDGELVVLHDSSLVRTTDVTRVYPDHAPWQVADFTYDELLRLDAGSWRASTYAGERIPTLDDVLDVLRDTGVGLLLELKNPHLYPGIVRDLAVALDSPRGRQARTRIGRLVVQSFDVAAMKEHSVLAPDVEVGLLGAPAVSSLPALATWAAQVNPSHLAADRWYVDRVHEAGMECFVWTVNRAAAMRRALRIGVDGVITDHPGRLSTLLADAVPQRQPSSGATWLTTASRTWAL